MTTTLSSILPQNTKYDFFQTQTHVILSIYLKNIDEQSVTSQFKSHSLSLTISNSLPLTDTTNLLDLKTDLFAQIDPLSSVVTCLKTRVEVKMLKVGECHWSDLQAIVTPIISLPEPVIHFTCSIQHNSIHLRLSLYFNE